MEVTVLTLNCWGIAGVSKDRQFRMTAIAAEIASGKYDFVFLQEVWVEKDYKMIASKVKQVLPHSHYFYSGVVGGGICIFSRSPIVEIFFHNWQVNGYMHKVHHGDWFGGKGLGICTVLHHGYRINLYVTHLHAEYDRDNDEYQAHRISQAFQVSQLIRYSRSYADFSILGGDLNTEPGDIHYRLIRYNTSLEDSFLATGKPEIEGTTNETPENSYSSPQQLAKNPNGKRIDYVMFSARQGLKVETLSCFKPLKNRVEGQSYSYSDHEAVCTKLKISESEEVKSKTPEEIDLCLQALQGSIGVCETTLGKLSQDRRLYWFMFAAMVVLLCSVPQTASTTGIFDYVIHYFLVTFRIVIVLVAAFTLIMATMWNNIEYHGILATKLAMITRVNALKGKYPSPVNEDFVENQLETD